MHEDLGPSYVRLILEECGVLEYLATFEGKAETHKEVIKGHLKLLENLKFNLAFLLNKTSTVINPGNYYKFFNLLSVFETSVKRYIEVYHADLYQNDVTQTLFKLKG
ncbi:hypothetical protein V5N15_03710 [Ligilactobacillus salivarius]|uniref:hypothetical protein n=1 Tax=Ligilactobacillus salivarius TaxID=1624 RepID=UPI00331530AA